MRPRRAAAALLSGALLLLPGCGSGGNSGKPIPKSQADQMTALIRLADQQSAAGTCSGAHDKVKRAQAVANNLPSSVGSSVRKGITDGLTRLDGLIGSECSPPQRTQTQTTPTTTTQTQTTTTPSTTTPTTTTPSTTTPTTTTPSTTTPTTTTPTTTTGTGTTTTGNGGTPPPPGGTG